MSKSAIIDKAQKLASKGNIKQAIKEWQKLLSESQDNGNIYNAIGDLQLKANMKNDAITAYLEAADAFKEAGFELKSIALYKKTIKVDDSRHDIYEKLADVHAERGLVGNAIGDYLKAAKYYVKKGDVQASLDVYRKMADLDPENADIRFKIAEMCQKEGFEKEAVEEFGKVLTLYEEKGMRSEAEEMREKILGLDPEYFKNLSASAIAAPSLDESNAMDGEMFPDDGSQSPELLGTDFLKGSSGVEEVPELAMPGESSQLTAEGLSQFEISSPERGPAEEVASPEIAVSPEEEGDAIVDAIPSPDPENFSPKKITESAFKGYLTEAEVYFKYGLNSKAIDQLLLVSKLCPDREEPHLKLKEIYIQEGITEKAIGTCCALARIYYAKGDEENVKETLNELSLLDQDGNYRRELDEEILAFENMEMSSEVEIGEDPASVTDLESNAPEGEDVYGFEAEASPVEAKEDINAEINNEISGEIPEGTPEEVSEEIRDEKEESLGWDLDPVDQEIGEDLAEDAIEPVEAESSLSEVEASPPEIEGQAMEDLVPEEGNALSEKLEAHPMGSVEEAFAEEASGNESSFEGLSDSGGGADFTSGEDSMYEAVEEAGEEAVSKAELKEDYVNLASILSEELGEGLEDSSGHDDTLLEGAFEELKKEVESTKNEKDLETHYDLGIAYKEMGMIPEAITEFELASQGGRFQDSIIMLANCYRMRGATKTAIKTIQDALEDSRCEDDMRVPLLYEMAIMVDLSGDKKKAGILYDEVYQAEPEFRDVAKRKRLNEAEQNELSVSESKSDTEFKKKNRISYI
ncbi:MAG: hypothetical protein ACE5FZ_05595 [Nitrospiria bacterium]